MTNGTIDADLYHMVMDEAYACLGCNHFTPFSRHQMDRAKSELLSDFHKMYAFNFVLSSERITIERAFGMLVMKWGVLQTTLKWDLELNCDVILTCVKLHNLCINEWIKGKRANDYHFQRSFVGEIEEMGTNLEVFDALTNPYSNRNDPLERACEMNATPKRRHVAEYIYNCGFRRTTK